MNSEKWRRTDRQVFFSCPLKSQGWLPDLRRRVTALQQLSILSSGWIWISLQTDFLQICYNFNAKKKVLTHLVYHIWDYKESYHMSYSQVAYRCYAWTNGEIKINFSSEGSYTYTVYKQDDTRQIGNSYFLAFSLLSLEIGRRYLTYHLW